MKKSKIAITLFVMTTMLSGCITVQMPEKPEQNQSSEVDKPQENPAEKPEEAFPYEEGQLYAVAYLGYDKSAAESYLKGVELATHRISDGEYYLIIPRYENMKMELYQTDVETMETKTLVFEQENAKPFILQCNMSDIFADATICFTYKGQTTEFSPYISLKDGSVIIGDCGLDITKE